jgi:hypothetical protein
MNLLFQSARQVGVLNCGAGGSFPCRLIWVLMALVVLGVAGQAAPLERDLGEGLGYVRLQELPGDLIPSNASPVVPSVVDVRYLLADTASASAFEAWLNLRARSRAPVFVLANEATSPEVLQLLSRRAAGSGVVVVGTQAQQFEPDFMVLTSRENERRAYEALAEGASLVSLLTDNPGKVRHDEASLSRERPEEPSAELAVNGNAAQRPPLDVTLQRAVHLHRALMALRKI